MKLRLVFAVTASVMAADALTKWAVRETFHLGQSVPVVGDAFRLTYILNPGAAFGLHVGPHSRQIFGVLALVAVVVLAGIIRQTPPGARGRLLGLSLILGGAMGNLLDRLRSPRGVVDFLDVGIGSLRWPVFNLADVGVTVGALLLVLLLWAEDEGLETAEVAAGRAEPRGGDR